MEPAGDWGSCTKTYKNTTDIMTHSLEQLMIEIASFIDERDWQQFHSPKNLSMALLVETAELLEIFQWQTEEQSSTPDETTLVRIEEEIGDVMIYLATLSQKFHIHPMEAALKKMKKNRVKYPAELVHGKADKYTSYSS